MTTYIKLEIHEAEKLIFDLIKLQSEINQLGISKYEYNYLTDLVEDMKKRIDSCKGDTINV